MHNKAQDIDVMLGRQYYATISCLNQPQLVLAKPWAYVLGQNLASWADVASAGLWSVAIHSFFRAWLDVWILQQAVPRPENAQLTNSNRRLQCSVQQHLLGTTQVQSFNRFRHDGFTLFRLDSAENHRVVSARCSEKCRNIDHCQLQI